MNEVKKNYEKSAATGVNPDYSAEIAEIIRSNLTPNRIREQILSYHENDIALALDILSKPERDKFYTIMDAEDLTNILEYSEKFGEYVNELGVKKRVAVLSQIDAATAAEALRDMDKSERDSLLDLMAPDVRSEIMLLNSFDEDEIGSKMSTNYIKIIYGESVKSAMSALVKQAAENDNISTLYVVDKSNVFCGAIDLKDLIIAREDTSLDDIITCSYPYVYAKSQVEECINKLKDYAEDSIPVLDSDNKLIGVITAQDLVEVVDDELSEDYAKFAGLSSEEELSEPIGLSIRKRMPWLIILLGLGLVVSSVIGFFEHVVTQLPIIMCFQSLILDMAGNVGTQSLAVTIRVLMDEKVSFKQKIMLIWKEMRVGLANGTILGILSFLLVGAYLFFILGNPVGFSLSISGCIGAALMLAMLISAVSGTVIPIFFQKLGVDPAVASGPLITTVNDLISVISYYGLAWVFLINFLHLV